ncbi:MAG: helix-turn-helix transcriptional regulator [Phycisphaerae bacterium]
MPGYPSLDPEALVRLRSLVKRLHESGGSALPHERIVELARDVHIDAGITIDFTAAEELGQPLVVFRVADRADPAPCLDVLSRREREIVALIADGLSNKQIGRRLHIALATVKDHVHRILDKTGLSNRAAVAAALKGHQAKPHDGTGRPLADES